MRRRITASGSAHGEAPALPPTTGRRQRRPHPPASTAAAPKCGSAAGRQQAVGPAAGSGDPAESAPRDHHRRRLARPRSRRDVRAVRLRQQERRRRGRNRIACARPLRRLDPGQLRDGRAAVRGRDRLRRGVRRPRPAVRLASARPGRRPRRAAPEWCCSASTSRGGSPAASVPTSPGDSCSCAEVGRAGRSRCSPSARGRCAAVASTGSSCPPDLAGRGSVGHLDRRRPSRRSGAPRCRGRRRRGTPAPVPRNRIVLLEPRGTQSVERLDALLAQAEDALRRTPAPRISNRRRSCGPRGSAGSTSADAAMWSVTRRRTAPWPGPP